MLVAPAPPTARAAGEPPAGAAYVPLSPARILDTRAGTGLSGVFRTGVARSFPVAGLGGVPANAVAVTGNLTVVDQTSAGYVSLGPAMDGAPSTSTLNFPRADIRANGVTVPLSGQGTLAATFVGSAGATTHLVFDVTGAFVADPAAGAVYVPVNPARVLDTRAGTGLSGTFPSGTARTFAVGGVGAVPAGAVAITGNLTVVGQTSAGYVSLGPVATDSPATSTLNFPRGDIRANGVTVPLGAGGTLSAVFVGGSGATSHLVLDVTGYFLAGPAAGSLFRAVEPARILDTRSGLGLAGAFANGVPRQVPVAGVGPVPAGTIAITGNLTITGHTSDGYVALGPLPVLTPTTSTLNAPRGDVRANNVTLPLGPDGTLSATFKGAARSSAHLVLDVTGYLVGGPVPDWLPGPDDTWWVPVPDGATRLPALVRFTGSGWGHGVGMSQYGALGRAQAGQTAAEILAHYYRDTSLGAIDPLTQVRVLVLAGHQPTEAAPLRIVGRGGTWTMDGGPGPFPADATLAVRPPLAGSTAWRYRVTAADATVLHEAATADRIRVYPGEGARLELPTKPSTYDEYRGVLRVIPSGTTLSVTNEVGIDAYLAGVVPVEMPPSWPAEALRAQAIAARSFAAHRLRPGVGTYDVFDDTRSQVYRGILAEKGTTDAAIAATAGVVVVHAGAPANTLFHSTGGGATEHNENAFVAANGRKVAGPLAYLRGSADTGPNGTAYDAASPYAAWQTGTYAIADLSAWFAADARTDVGTLVALDLRDRGVSGRLISITLIGTGGTKTVSGDVFRAAFNAGRPAGSPILRANAFAVAGG